MNSDIKWNQKEDLIFETSVERNIHLCKPDTLVIVYPTHLDHNRDRGGIFIYDGYKCCKLIKYSECSAAGKSGKIRFNYMSSDINLDLQKAWVLNSKTKLHEIDFRNVECPSILTTNIINSAFYIRSFKESTIFRDNNGLMNIVGGICSDQHFILNPENGTTKMKYTFPIAKLSRQGLIRFGLFVYQDVWFLLGGISGSMDYGKMFDDVYIYDTKTKRWSEADWKLPEKLAGFGCSLVTFCNEDYLLIVGGYKCANLQDCVVTDNIKHRNIYLMEWSTKRWISLGKKVLGPKTGMFHISVIDKRNYGRLFYGFIKKIINSFS